MGGRKGGKEIKQSKSNDPPIINQKWPKIKKL